MPTGLSDDPPILDIFSIGGSSIGGSSLPTIGWPSLSPIGKLQSVVACHVKLAYASRSLTVAQSLEVAQAIMRPAVPAPNTCICLDNLRAEAVRAEVVSRRPNDVTLDKQQNCAVTTVGTT
jgi:hypothetical protein